MGDINQEMSRHLDNLISEQNVSQTTDLIRKVKHSSKIKECVNGILSIKKNYSRLSYPKIEELAKSRHSFLLNNYNDIFFKVLKDEINISLLFNFISILEKIENGILNQHEASFQVGTILKKIYIDSTIKRNNKTDNSKKKKKKQKNKLSFDEWSKKN